MEQIVLSEYIEEKVEKLAGKTSLIYSSTEIGSKVSIFGKALTFMADLFDNLPQQRRKVNNYSSLHSGLIGFRTIDSKVVNKAVPWIIT